MPQNVGLLATRSPGPLVGTPPFGYANPLPLATIVPARTGIYVRSGATGLANGSSWANAFTNVANAATASLLTDTDIWVADDHSEATASCTFNLGLGTPASPYQRMVCVDHTKNAPFLPADLRTTAIVATNTTGGITITGFGLIYGIQFRAGTAGNAANIVTGNNAANCRITYVNCGLRFVGTGAAAGLFFGAPTASAGANGRLVDLIGCTITFSNVAQSIYVREGVGRINFRGGSFAGSVPTILFGSTTSDFPNIVVMDGVDLSTINTTLVASAYNGSALFNFVNCKLNAAAVVMATPSGTAGYAGPETTLAICDSGSLNYRSEKHNYQGHLTTEAVLVEASGGASDGTTTISHKVITTANPSILYPFDGFAGGIWNGLTGSPRTFSIDILSDGGSGLTNVDVWVECEVLDTSGFPLATLYSSNGGVYANPTTIPSTPSPTWTTTGLTNPRAQTISLTFTPQVAGYIRWVVRVAKPNQTLWINPSPTVV